MRPIIMALLAMLIYAFQNVIMEQKLSKYTTMVLLVYFYSSLLPVALVSLGFMKANGQTVISPSGSLILVTIGAGLLYFLADYCYVSAYTSGGNVITVTSIVVMFPVFASLIKFFWTGGTPNFYQIGACLLAIAAVILAAKGSGG